MKKRENLTRYHNVGLNPNQPDELKLLEALDLEHNRAAALKRWAVIGQKAESKKRRK